MNNVSRIHRRIKKKCIKNVSKVKIPSIYEPRMHPIHSAMNSTKQSK